MGSGRYKKGTEIYSHFKFCANLVQVKSKMIPLSCRQQIVDARTSLDHKNSPSSELIKTNLYLHGTPEPLIQSDYMGKDLHIYICQSTKLCLYPQILVSEKKKYLINFHFE